MIPGDQAERGWLLHHAIRPRKSLGQNFLVQPQVATGLVRAMRLDPGAEVMEIGAGSGALTRALLDAGARVWAYEIDARLCALLRERFAGPLAEGRLRLSESSILGADPALLDGASGSRVYLAGNLPYAITTPILLWAIGHRDRFSGGAVLVQREVAERLAAGPGGRTYGSITVWIGYHARVRKVATVEPGAFWPVPNVDSSLITLDFHRSPPVELPDPSALEEGPRHRLRPAPEDAPRLIRGGPRRSGPRHRSARRGGDRSDATRGDARSRGIRLPRPRRGRRPAMSRGGPRTLDSLAKSITRCELCPRLREHCRSVAIARRRAYRDQVYWGRPVPGFGDPGARLLLVGLAPGAHGSNRTGRMFTGDASGDFLYAALARAGFANTAVSRARGDGLALRDCFITAVARCAPPGNRPTPAEIAACRPYLLRELELLTRVRVILALGGIAWTGVRDAMRHRGVPLLPQPKFAHAATWRPGPELPLVVASYHPSQQNTQTGRLTAAMFDAAVGIASAALV